MKIARNRLRKIIREVAGTVPERVSFDIPIPKDLEDIHSRLKYAGRELFLVGGAVRDALMGKSPKDYDVATNASPEEVIKILQKDPSLRLDLTGKQFGVVRVKTKNDGEYEIATFREDIGKGKGTSVKFSTIENDVKRRDLTINALFYDMDSREVVDYVGGIKDIENGIIRAVGEPGQRFDEDRIRILRAIRFAGRMGSDLDASTKKAILEDNQLIDTETGQPIPADRITEEFVKGLKSSADVGHFLSLTDELGMFDQLLPGLEIEIQGGVTQDHVAQIAGLLRNNSSDLVVPTLKRMRYSNDESKTIKFLLDLMSLNRDTAAGLKKNFNRLNINSEHLHNFAEITGTPSEAVVRGFLEFAAAPPAGNPKDLMAQGLKGPEIGQAMADAEAEAYSDFIGEVRKYVREIILREANEYKWSMSSKKNMMLDKDGMEQSDKDEQERFLKSMSLMEGLLVEQEVKFSGILKIMPSAENISLINSLISKLPPEAVPLSPEKFHVTLIHQNILKPYRKILKQMDKEGLLPLPPAVNLDTRLVPRESETRQSWVLYATNQDEIRSYVNSLMEIIGGSANPEPERVFHITIANLTGKPGDSVR